MVDFFLIAMNKVSNILKQISHVGFSIIKVVNPIWIAPTNKNIWLGEDLIHNPKCKNSFDVLQNALYSYPIFFSKIIHKLWNMMNRIS